MAPRMDKIREIAEKLFTPSEISRFNAFRIEFSKKYLSPSAYSLKWEFKRPTWSVKLPKWAQLRYFTSERESNLVCWEFHLLGAASIHRF